MFPAIAPIEGTDRDFASITSKIVLALQPRPAVIPFHSPHTTPYNGMQRLASAIMPSVKRVPIPARGVDYRGKIVLGKSWTARPPQAP